MRANDDNRFSEQDLLDDMAREESERLDAEYAAADALDAERDAYHAAQDALEQVWLGEAYAEAGKCTCGAVASFHEPAYFYCVCDL
jgi:hypothetical protein